MSGLSDAAMRHLRESLDRPDASPRYDVGELLGRGGMGAVYRAHDTQLGRDVALKVLTLDGEHESGMISARLAREARVLAQLEHPGIVAVHDAGTLGDGRPYYVMRLVRGRSLADVAGALRDGDDGGVGERLRIFLRVCDAVSFAHARGVIHRDLKPSNIMVGEYGEVLVVDWGVAKVRGTHEERAAPEHSATTAAPRGGEDGAVDVDATQEGAVVGTPGFMPPELAAGGAKDADARADIFALGVMLRDLARSDRDTLPPPLEAIVQRAMAPDPSARHPDVASLADDVRHWLDGERVASYKESVLERLARQYRRNQAIVLLFLAYVAVRLIILFWRHV